MGGLTHFVFLWNRLAGRQARTGGNGACGFLPSVGDAACCNAYTDLRISTGGGLRKFACPGLVVHCGAGSAAEGKGKGGGAMILQSSENGGTVGGDTPARVLGEGNRDTIVASSPPPRTSP